MAVVAADLDDDGWIDVFQTNDSAPNFLFRNTGDGRFREIALEASGVRSLRAVTGAMATTRKTSTATAGSTCGHELQPLRHVPPRERRG